MPDRRRRPLTDRELDALADVDVARGVGSRDPATMKRSYQRADPATTLRAIEGTADPEADPKEAPSGQRSDTPREASGGTSTL